MAEPITGEQLAAISRELGRLKAQYYGKGPTESKSYINDNFLFCTMRGGLTTVEQTLVAGGHEDLVRDVRLRFQDQMSMVFRDAVEKITGKVVVTYHSQLLLKPDYTVEMFVLAEPDDPLLEVTSPIG